MAAINKDWGVPEPYNMVVFGMISLIIVYLFKKILALIFKEKKV